MKLTEVALQAVVLEARKKTFKLNDE